MPTVPRYKPLDAASAPLPTPFVSPEAPSEAFGGRPAVRAQAAAERLGEMAVGTALRQEELAERERLVARKAADDLVLQEAEAKLTQLETQLLGLAKSKAGKEALPLPDQIRENWIKGNEEIERGLVTPEQRMQFRARAMTRQAMLERAVLAHVDTERERFDNETFEALLANERSAAAAAFDNEERLRLSVTSIYAASEAYAARNGKSTEWARAVASRAAGDAVSSAIWANLNFGNIEKAASYFEAYKGLIDAENAEKLSEGIGRRKLLANAQRATDAIMASGPGTQGEAMQAAREIQNPELRQAVESLIRQRWQEREETLQEMRREKIKAALEAVERTGRVDGVPEDIWQALDSQDRARVAEFAESLRKPADEMREAAAFTEFSGLTRSQKAALTEQDLLLKYRPRMSQVAYKEIVREWQAARAAEAGKDGADEEYAKLMTPKEIVRNELIRFGLMETTEKPEEKLIYMETLRRAKERAQFLAAQGKKVPLESIVRQILYEAGKTKKEREATLTDSALFPKQRTVRVRYADIPLEKRREIEAIISVSQKTPTKELVELLYAAPDEDEFDRILMEAK